MLIQFRDSKEMGLWEQTRQIHADENDYPADERKDEN